MIDEITLKGLSKKFEIDSFTVLREYLQVKFLDKLYKESTLKNTYFKGGTCLRLVFGSSRFSEDMDFTTFESKDKIKGILERVVKNLSFEFPDISVKDLKTLQGFSFKIYLPTEISEQPLTVRLDFTKREKGRDLFDLWFLLSKGGALDKEFIGKKLEFYKEDFNLKKLIRKIKGWEDKDIDYDLRRFLPVSERKIIPELKRLILSK